MKIGDIVYICGINIHKGGRINLNKPPRKGTVVTEHSGIQFEDGERFNDYPGYKIFDNLIDCQHAYERMKKDAISFCRKQMNKFYDVIEKLEDEFN